MIWAGCFEVWTNLMVLGASLALALMMNLLVWLLMMGSYVNYLLSMKRIRGMFSFKIQRIHLHHSSLDILRWSVSRNF